MSVKICLKKVVGIRQHTFGFELHHIPSFYWLDAISVNHLRQSIEGNNTIYQNPYNSSTSRSINQ